MIVPYIDFTGLNKKFENNTIFFFHKIVINLNGASPPPLEPMKFVLQFKFILLN